MLTITETQARAIDEISRTRTDGGLGVVFDGENFKVQDVRTDSRYAAYSDILAEAQIAKPALTQLQFLRLFTVQERIAIRSSADPVIVDFLHLLNLAQEISLEDPDTQAGMEYLVKNGILKKERADEILK